MKRECALLTISIFDDNGLKRGEVSFHVSVWGNNAGGGECRLDGEEDESFGEHVYLGCGFFV